MSFLFHRTADTTRRVFVSYHHANDQQYYDRFSRIFSDHYQVVTDRSIDRLIDSNDPEYIMRRIRENHITGTSCTIVLCGAETRWRKYVDWEIKATLDKEHGLIGICLPTAPLTDRETVLVPQRFFSNYETGYAVWFEWEDLSQGPSFLCERIEFANSRCKSLIDNSAPLRPRNGGND